MTRRTLTTTIAAAALVAGLTGCGVGSAVVGLHDAPAERKDVAPLNVDGAETVPRACSHPPRRRGPPLVPARRRPSPPCSRARP